MVRLAARDLVAVLLALLIPSAAFAQASITGVVKDASGAVLPGVTVEASSPALIEKARTVVTDGSGQYRIVTLPPGAYALTFTLAGFSSVRREGIELRGTFTAAVDAELRVGSVAETVTVTGETPLVDIQSATQQRVLGSEVVDAIPTSRMPSSLVELIPGITVTQGAGNWYGLGAHDVGGSVGDIVGIFAIHGGTFQDSRMMINGLSTGWGNEAFETGYTPNMSAIQETVVDTAASVENEVGGVRTNIIPKDGGNVFAGTIYGSYTNEHLTSNNVDADLRSRGLPFANSVKVNGDFNPGVRRSDQARQGVVLRCGALPALGQLCRRRLCRHDAGRSERLGLHARPVAQGDQQRDVEGRAGARHLAGERRLHKFAFSWSQQTSCKCPSLQSATQVGGTENRWGHPQRIITGDWTAPLTSRLLVDASVLHQINKWGFFQRDSSPVDAHRLPRAVQRHEPEDAPDGLSRRDERDAALPRSRCRMSPARMPSRAASSTRGRWPTTTSTPCSRSATG